MPRGAGEPRRHGGLNPSFKPGRIEPRYSESVVFKGISVDDQGRPHSLGARVSCRRACLNAVEYRQRFGYTPEQACMLLLLRAGARAGQRDHGHPELPLHRGPADGDPPPAHPAGLRRAAAAGVGGRAMPLCGFRGPTRGPFDEWRRWGAPRRWPIARGARTRPSGPWPRPSFWGRPFALGRTGPRVAAPTSGGLRRSARRPWPCGHWPDGLPRPARRGPDGAPPAGSGPPWPRGGPRRRTPTAPRPSGGAVSGPGGRHPPPWPERRPRAWAPPRPTPATGPGPASAVRLGCAERAVQRRAHGGPAGR